MNLFFQKMSSPVGLMYVVCDSKAIKSIHFANTWSEYKKNNDCKEKETPLLNESIQQLTEYFNNQRKEFNLPLAPDGTAFQKKAWNALLKIPYGKTFSYLQQAQKVGNAKAVRAIGGANGKNPIPVIIPCHRVIGKNGSLVGYASGLNIKKKLLALEGMDC